MKLKLIAGLLTGLVVAAGFGIIAVIVIAPTTAIWAAIEWICKGLALCLGLFLLGLTTVAITGLIMETYSDILKWLERRYENR